MSILSSIADTVGSVFKPLAPIAPFFSAVSTFMGGQQRNEAQQAAAQSQMDFQERMSNTAYQRVVKDLEAAGLNPMLAYGNGPASSAVGSMAQLTNPAAEASEAYARSLASSAQAAEAYSRIPTHEQAAKKIAEEIKNIPIEGDRLREAAYLLWSQAKYYGTLNWNAREIEKQIIETTENLKKDGVLKDLDIKAAQDLSNLGREFGQLKPIIDVLLQVLGTFTSKRTVNIYQGK